MRRLLFAANWKMHKTRADAREFMADFAGRSLDGVDADVAIFPPATCLAVLEEAGGVAYGAQNVHFEAKGAFTGELAVSMLEDLGCSYALIGHSERRAMFGDTDEGVRKKIDACLVSAVKPLVCVGESLDERERNGHMAWVARQVRAACQGLGEADAAKLTFAYEPIWAIGTGKTASDEQAQEMCAHVRKVLRDEVGSVADSIRVLYGGSAKPANIEGLAAQPDVDGALVGGASLKPDSFHELVVKGAAAA